MWLILDIIKHLPIKRLSLKPQALNLMVNCFAHFTIIMQKKLNDPILV